jgi:hypothetical protein
LLDLIRLLMVIDCRLPLMPTRRKAEKLTQLEPQQRDFLFQQSLSLVPALRNVIPFKASFNRNLETPLRYLCGSGWRP